MKKLSLCLFLSMGSAILAGCATGTFQDNQYYTVQKGDTLSKIAATYNLSYQSLARQNHLQYPYMLQVGQRLYVGVAPMGNVNYAYDLPQRTQINNTSTSEVQPVTSANALQSQNLDLSKYAAQKSVAAKPASPSVVGLNVNTDDQRQSNAITWAWPVDGTITQAFGEGTDLLGRGVQISVPAHSKVLASAQGEVIFSGEGARGYGQMIIIKHGNNFLTAYTDLSKTTVHQGQHVLLGDAIAESGTINGKSVVHFEVRKFGNPVNPILYLPVPDEYKVKGGSKPISAPKIDAAN